jgi:hypothetical protein
MPRQRKYREKPGSKGPSAVGGPGARHHRAPRPIAVPTWCSVTSQRQAPTGSGSGTSLVASVC